MPLSATQRYNQAFRRNKFATVTYMLKKEIEQATEKNEQSKNFTFFFLLVAFILCSFIEHT